MFKYIKTFVFIYDPSKTQEDQAKALAEHDAIVNKFMFDVMNPRVRQSSAPLTDPKTGEFLKFAIVTTIEHEGEDDKLPAGGSRPTNR